MGTASQIPDDQDCGQFIAVPYKAVDDASPYDIQLENDKVNGAKIEQLHQSHNDIGYLLQEAENEEDADSDTTQNLPNVPDLAQNLRTRLNTNATRPRNLFIPQAFVIKFNGQRVIFRSTDIVSNHDCITLEILKYEEFCKDVQKQLHTTLQNKHVFANGLDAYGGCEMNEDRKENDGLIPANDGRQWRATLLSLWSF